MVEWICETCEQYLTKAQLIGLNELYGAEMFPLDTEWRHCIQGSEGWLNCRRRLTPYVQSELEIRLKLLEEQVNEIDYTPGSVDVEGAVVNIGRILLRCVGTLENLRELLEDKE